MLTVLYVLTVVQVSEAAEQRAAMKRRIANLEAERDNLAHQVPPALKF